jgi:hypothetical protein
MSSYVKQNHELPAEVLDKAKSIVDKHVRNAYVKALREQGWTFESISVAFGMTRERVRQIALKDITDRFVDIASEFPLPTPPIAPEVVKVKREYVMPSDKVLARLLELQPLAQQVRSHSKKYRSEAEEYSHLLNHAISVEGVSTYRLSKLLGITHGAIRFRLARYGYKPDTTGKSSVYSAILDKNRVGITTTPE